MRLFVYFLSSLSSFKRSKKKDGENTCQIALFCCEAMEDFAKAYVSGPGRRGTPIQLKLERSMAVKRQEILPHPDHLPKEDCPMLPLHPCGVSKAAEDLLCFQCFRNYGIKIARVRLFNCDKIKALGLE
jgi:nucleoside-diphosphate-sugar epimerase